MTPSKSAESEWAILKHELQANWDVDTAPWTVSESVTYRGFFMHGWEKALRAREGRDEMNTNEKALAALKRAKRRLQQSRLGSGVADGIKGIDEAISLLESHPVAGQVSEEAVENIIDEWSLPFGVLDHAVDQETIFNDFNSMMDDLKGDIREALRTAQQPQAPAVEVPTMDELEDAWLSAGDGDVYSGIKAIRDSLISRQGGR